MSVTPLGAQLGALFAKAHDSSGADAGEVIWPVMHPSAIQAVQFCSPSQQQQQQRQQPWPHAPSAPPITAAVAKARGNSIPSGGAQLIAFAAATQLDRQLNDAATAAAATMGDRDVLRLRDLYRLKPKEKLAVGKYVPDPCGAPPSGKTGSRKSLSTGSASSARRDTRDASSGSGAAAVYGSAGGAMLRLRRQSTSSGGSGAVTRAAAGSSSRRAQSGNVEATAIASYEGSGSDDDDGDAVDADEGGGDGGGSCRQRSTDRRSFVGKKRRQATIGDISSSGDDELNDVGNRAAGVLAARSDNAIVQTKDTATYRLLKALYPFPISCDTLYFPVAYPPPTAKDTDDPRGTPKAINVALHGCPDDDVRLHEGARGLGNGAGQAPSAPQPPLFTSVTIQRGNLNKVPLFKIGPNAVAFKVVINAFESSGAQYTPHSNWNIMWAKRATPELLSRLGPYQKLNHFPGAWGIGRKDNLHKNIARMKQMFGSATFDVVPVGFICPQDEALLREDVASNTPLPTTERPAPRPPTYICKPVASSCGKGITLSMGMPPMPPAGGKSIIVQRYVGNPLLIDGRKFDLRVYCVVMGFNPLRIYLFDEGLVRFAAERYPGPEADLESTYKHLTNYSVNKTAQLARESKGKSEAANDPIDIKWALSDFKAHLKQLHGEAEGARVWESAFREMQDVVIKAFLSIEAEVNHRLRSECRDPTGRGCFEMYGLDLMLDDRMKVFLIEVNIMPSLATGTSLDKAVKSRMLAHMLTMVGVVPYARRDAAAQGDDAPRGTGVSAHKYFYPPPPGAKRSAACTAAEATATPTTSAANASSSSQQRIFYNEKLLTNFNNLTSAERMMLLEADEEYARRGGFTRIFPTPETPKRYFGLFTDGVNRNNYLLASWLAMQARKAQ